MNPLVESRRFLYDVVGSCRDHMDLFDEYGGDEEEEGHEEKWDKWCDDMEIAYDDIIDKLLTGRWNTELNEDAIIRTFDDGAFHHKLAINASSLARHPHNNIKMKLFEF